MAMTPTVTEIEFNNIEHLLTLIKPLMVEGYSIATKTIFEEFPREDRIKKYVVYLVDKNKEMKITLKESEEELRNLVPYGIILAFKQGENSRI